jgi:hypothetical protein
MADYLTDADCRDPVGRLLTAIYRLDSGCRMTTAAKMVDLSERDFVSAVAEAEWGGLVTRQERDDGIYLVLTKPGLARAAAILRAFRA